MRRKQVQGNKSGIVRERRTGADYEAASAFLVDYAAQHYPVSVRQLYYVAGMRNVPGIGKDEKHYRKIQEQVLKLRQEERLPYENIVDRSRNSVGFPGRRDPVEEVDAAADFYKLDYWLDQPVVVEVLIDKDALVGVIEGVTNDEYHVRLQPYRGSSSESFAWEMIQYHCRREETRPLHFLHLGDLDLYGQDAQAALKRKLYEFAKKAGLTIELHHLGLTWDQVRLYGLQSAERPQKWPGNANARKLARQRWPHETAVELDALPPDDLRALVRNALARYMPDDVLTAAREREEEHRRELREWAAAMKAKPRA